MKPHRKHYRALREHWSAHPERITSKIGLFFDRHFVDHAFIRAIYRNTHHLGGGVYRSSQPSPRYIRKLKAEGFKTIVNLRGENRSASYLLEKLACEQQGIHLISIQLNSRRVPRPEEVETWVRLLETCERPLLFHCKSGADRAGIAAAMYLLLEGADPALAKKQLSLRYYHLSHSSTGILDHFIQSYIDFNEHSPMPFLDWYRNHCDSQAIESSFKPSTFSAWLVDKVLHRE